MIEVIKSFAVAFGMTARQLLQQQQIPFVDDNKKRQQQNQKYNSNFGCNCKRQKQWNGNRDYSTVFLRVPMPSMVIWISSLLWSVKESGGTMPVPVSRKQP
jgi:hypothetical protein